MKLWINNAWVLFQATQPYSGLVIGVVALTVFTTLLSRRSPSYDMSGSEKLNVAAGVVVAVVCLGLGVFGSYQTHQFYLGDVEIVSAEDDGAGPTYEERPAFVSARIQASNLLDVRGERDGDLTYLPDQDRFTGMVVRPRQARLNGYVGVQSMDVGLTGAAQSEVCTFDERADRRLGGLFGKSLERAIVAERFDVRIDDDNAYGACVANEDDELQPIVVVPLTAYEGFYPSVEVPAGVAVYNGATDDVDIFDEVESGQLPGPVFPISVAEKMREATAANGSFGDYLFDRVGYATTDAIGGDEEDATTTQDPNAGNSSEFSLGHAGEDGGSAYVTPLTLRGRTTLVDAVGSIETSTVEEGQLNTFYVHDLEQSRVSNASAADRIKTDYSDLPDWASGMRIFEITPVSGDEWVASLGQEQYVAYRIRINADGSSCLERADGTQIRCGRETDTNGNGPGVQLAPDNDGSDDEPVDLPTDANGLDGLSDAELAQLQQQITDEILDRLGGHPSQGVHQDLPDADEPGAQWGQDSDR